MEGHVGREGMSLATRRPRFAMKLAEALMERKSIKTRMEEIKQRIYRNAQVQEGELPGEPPAELFGELAREVDRFVALVARIAATNGAARLADGTPLAAAIVQKDMLHYLCFVHTNFADKATPTTDRYSRREIKTIPAMPIADVRRRADEIAKRARVLEVEIQATNWAIDLVDG